jgi:hypothetical protein
MTTTGPKTRHWSDHMPRAERSGTITTIAVINLIIGFPCLCCGGLASGNGLLNYSVRKDVDKFKIDDKAAASSPIMQGMQQGMELEIFKQKELPSLHLINMLGFGMGALGSLLLFVSGILLLTRIRLGKWLCIIACVIIFIATLSHLAYTAFVVYPVIKKFGDKQKQEGKTPAANAATGGTIGAFLQPCGGLLVGGLYSLIAIGVMVTAPESAFGIRSARRRRPDDDFDDRRDDFEDEPRDDYDERRGEDDDRFRAGH